MVEEAGRFKENWRAKQRQSFQIAGITVCLKSGLDLSTVRFKAVLEQFVVDRPGEDTVTLVIQPHFPEHYNEVGSLIPRASMIMRWGLVIAVIR